MNPNLKIKAIPYKDLTEEQKAEHQQFMVDNFYIPQEYADPAWQAEEQESFFVPADLYFFAYINGKLAGTASLRRREVEFGGLQLAIAGFGDLAVRKDFRHQGIASNLLEARMQTAKKSKCDIAFLDTDIPKLKKLFGKFGFVQLEHGYTFIGKSGKTHTEEDGMIAPVTSVEKFKIVLHGKQPLDIGIASL